MAIDPQRDQRRNIDGTQLHSGRQFAGALSCAALLFVAAPFLAMIASVAWQQGLGLSWADYLGRMKDLTAGLKGEVGLLLSVTATIAISTLVACVPIWNGSQFMHAGGWLNKLANMAFANLIVVIFFGIGMIASVFEDPASWGAVLGLSMLVALVAAASFQAAMTLNFDAEDQERWARRTIRESEAVIKGVRSLLGGAEVTLGQFAAFRVASGHLLVAAAVSGVLCVRQFWGLGAMAPRVALSCLAIWIASASTSILIKAWRLELGIEWRRLQLIVAYSLRLYLVTLVIAAVQLQAPWSVAPLLASVLLGSLSGGFVLPRHGRLTRWSAVRVVAERRAAKAREAQSFAEGLLAAIRERCERDAEAREQESSQSARTRWAEAASSFFARLGGTGLKP